jgi:hypothetical protein
MRADWEGSLLQGALAEQFATGGDTSTGIAGGVFITHFPDGSIDTTDAGAGQVVKGQVFTQLTTASSQDAARAEISRTLDGYGLTTVSVSFVTYRDTAVAVVAQLSAGSQLTEFDTIRQAITGSPAIFEGVYFEVVDSAGSPVAVSTTAFRTGAGSQWVHTKLSGTVGEVTGG